MSKNLKEKVVVITGASAGVGRAAAREFAQKGARVGLIARGLEGLQAVTKEVQELGSLACSVSADVANADQLEKAAHAIEEELGEIDVWVNNAMVSVFSPIKEMQSDEYERVTAVTYLGYVYGTQAALRRFLPRNRGKIIQVGSALSYRGIPLQSAYCGAKHAIVGFTESLRTELLHDKSRVEVAMVHLPAINTPQFDWVKSRLSRTGQPVPPIFQPEVPARAIVWCAQNQKSEILLGWPTLKTVWGGRIAPGIADWYLARKGYEDQQTNESEDPDRANNLWDPVEGNFGAHGRFNDSARDHSIEFWLRVNVPRFALLGLGLMSFFLIKNSPKKLFKQKQKAA
jgi:short-subunit dehydrogenase